MPARDKKKPVTAAVQPQLLRWARERVPLTTAALAKKVGLKEERVIEWEATGKLTLAQLEKVAGKTYTPVGYLFLPIPPREDLPIADFRRVAGQPVGRPSPDLLDTIYVCQQRQNWYREHLVAEGERPLPFVGSARLTEQPAIVAGRIRAVIGLDDAWSGSVRNTNEAFRSLVEKVEAACILVIRNGVVGNNNYRKLSVSEFRGFALSDEYAPLVFINAGDWPAAKIFTLAHELGHIWLGHSGVSDADMESDHQEEHFCNEVAAEVLAPMAEFRDAWRKTADPLDEARRLADLFKVSMLVALIRARAAGLISQKKFDALYEAEREGFPPTESKTGEKGGGDFYRTQGSRLSKRFARAVIVSALEGRTTFTEAFHLLGLREGTFDEYARKLGVVH
ncbi:MAG: ImmA/IrrE family metallo-endopeptidase [Acidobacteria bacterium]|nr:ImmA/IrrE family metallo-endopeptidase [Acidobacteriota bacterium]MBI3655400.1 ImmA/IrrE family metallo-endopeptidase [Acidobacteriota bacterium]